MPILFCSLQRIRGPVQLGCGDDEGNKKVNQISSSNTILKANLPAISFASSWKSWATCSQASWGPAPGIWGFFPWHLENRFPDRAFYWFDILIKSTQIWNSKWRKITPAITTERMWNLQPGNCWSGLPSHPPVPPAVPSPTETCGSYTHTQPVLLGNLQFAFESDHPLWFSAAVHVKTALNSSRNRWHTSVDVFPSTPCWIPQGRSEVLLPLPPLGAVREKLVALHTSHPRTHCCWPLHPHASSFVNVSSRMHISIPSLLNRAEICPSFWTSCAFYDA